MKFFKSIFYIFIISALFSSCIMDDGAIDVELKNETDRKIEFVYFSKTINRSLPLELASGDSIKVSYDSVTEDLNFKIKYNDEEYSGRTNYIQDKARYTLKIFKDGDELKSIVSGNRDAVTLRKSN